jgi:endonuclease/exonuclease/phosphatase family metal-dependent hydrolase
MPDAAAPCRRRPRPFFRAGVVASGVALPHDRRGRATAEDEMIDRRRRRRRDWARHGGRSLVVATYNIHSCVGIDRRYDPDRIAGVLRELEADIIGLQEVGMRHRFAGAVDQYSYFAKTTGLEAVASTLGRNWRGRFGNALLSRYPVRSVRHIDLSVAGREPRGAIDAELSIEGRRLRVVVTHLGLRAGERRQQIQRLLLALAQVPSGAEATVVMGDLNEWRGRRGGIPALDRRLGRTPARRTFPSWLPVLSLDRIYAAGSARIAALAVHRSALARIASDHLPLRAALDWSPPRARS